MGSGLCQHLRCSLRHWKKPITQPASHALCVQNNKLQLRCCPQRDVALPSAPARRLQHQMGRGTRQTRSRCHPVLLKVPTQSRQQQPERRCAHGLLHRAADWKVVIRSWKIHRNTGLCQWWEGVWQSSLTNTAPEPWEPSCVWARSALGENSTPHCKTGC